MSEKGMPRTADDRFEAAKTIVEEMTGAGIPLSDIYLDPVVSPVSAEPEAAMMVLETIHRVMTEFKGVHTICGLSNVSYGLPQRKLLNQTFFVMCTAAGLDGVILDPLDARIMSNLYAGLALTGKDEFCINYLGKSRENKLVV